jgi:hypothetical protein
VRSRRRPPSFVPVAPVPWTGPRPRRTRVPRTEDSVFGHHDGAGFHATSRHPRGGQLVVKNDQVRQRELAEQHTGHDLLAGRSGNTRRQSVCSPAWSARENGTGVRPA